MKNSKWKYIFIILVLVAVLVWMAVLVFPDTNLHLISCDVGQGDATLIVYGKTQILIDGGPNYKVTNCLSRYIPFWDREIEVVILTHPQTDHYMGLIDVLKSYNVDYFLANSLDSSNQSYSVLKSLVGGSNTKIVNPTKGMVFRLGMIYLDIVNPTSDFIKKNTTWQMPQKTQGVLDAYTSNIDPNQFSIVAIVSYKNFDALFTGDIDNQISDAIANDIRKNKENTLEYIKIPHHGSKNGLTENLLVAVSPEVAVISVGKNNSYGQPHQEILKMLKDRGVKTLRTDEEGNIEIVTDGEGWTKI